MAWKKQTKKSRVIASDTYDYRIEFLYISL